MKICLIASLFPPYHRGGAEVVVRNVVSSLSEDHEVVVITIAPWKGIRSLFSREDQWKDPRTGREIRVIRFYPLNIFSFMNISGHGTLARLLWHGLDMMNVHSFFTIRSILEKEKPDAVLTHNLKGIGYTIPAAIHSAGIRRWIHTIHDLALLHPTGLRILGLTREGAVSRLLVRLYRIINRRLFGSPPIVVSPSRFLLDAYRTANFFKNSKCHVIPNPLAVPLASDVPRSKQDPTRFFYSGQLEPYKGILWLLQIWKTVREKFSNSELHIMGDGSGRTTVEAASRMDPSIHYHGSTNDPEQLALQLGRMHFSVVPTFAYESFSMAVAESLSAGVPVIASRIGAIPELVREGSTGFLFTPGDDQDFIRAVTSAMAVSWPLLHEACRRSSTQGSLEAYRAALTSLL